MNLLREVSSIIKDLGWKGLGQTAIGTLMLSVLFGGVDLINALFNLPVTLINALADALAALNAGTLIGFFGFISEALGVAAGSFGSGWTGLLGPFQGPFGVALGLIMIWEVLYFLDILDTDFLGVVIDLPDFFLSNDESNAVEATGGEEDS
ncbi:hypothetical protein ACFQH6_19400 [Halobacteriaceae archaeon GCM10025711]